MPNLKRNQPLPDADHVMRHIPRKLQECDDDGKIIGFLPAAFVHREGEDYLSANWLEYFGGTHVSNAAACKSAIQSIRKGAQAKFGVAQVSRVKVLAKHTAKPVRVVYHPNSASNPSHSAIFMDLPVPDAVCEDLAREFYKERY